LQYRAGATSLRTALQALGTAVTGVEISLIAIGLMISLFFGVQIDRPDGDLVRVIWMLKSPESPHGWCLAVTCTP
jgi:hypothetical protein